MDNKAAKIDKANRYAQEPQRFHLEKFSLTFHGDNNDHAVSFDNGAWQCDCEYFMVHGWCCHSKALEIMLDKMLPEMATA